MMEAVEVGLGNDVVFLLPGAWYLGEDIVVLWYFYLLAGILPAEDIVVLLYLFGEGIVVLWYFYLLAGILPAEDIVVLLWRGMMFPRDEILMGICLTYLRESA